MSDTPSEIGRYRILQTLGRGGMGSLFLAQDPRIDRQVAIKVLREQPDNAEYRERFAREARSIGRLNHPNIVTIFDVGEHDGFPYIVMEYVRGRSLAGIIAEEPPLPLPVKLQIAEGVCAGLAYAHSAGVIHRDVKPANVMVTSDHGVKILDFGIAQLTHLAESHLTQAGAIFGTLNYLSPEMVAGLPIDHRADIFAVGAVLYELVTGRKLFPGTLAEGLLHRVMTGVHEPLSVVVPGISPELNRILERSIATTPADRYQDLTQMGRDLARCRLELSRIGAPDPVVPVPATRETSPDPTRVQLPQTAIPEAAAGRGEDGDGTVFLSTGAGASVTPDVGAMPDVRLLVGRCPDPRQAGRTIPVPESGITLGRAPDCSVVINDHGWSRHHAAIEWQKGGFVIRDLGSSNGTFVNGRRVRDGVPEPLFFGAVITIGATTLTFSYGRDTTLPDLVGAEIAGRYMLLRLLRESAKAAVYAASDRNVPHEVAVKLLSPELEKYEEYRHQFEREARIAAQLQHPHICRIVDAGLTRFLAPGGREIETHFVCYELMAGGSLARRLSTGEPPGLHEVSRWIAMLGAALEYAHGESVVHGDVKPSAIVFDAAGHLYLTDFAIAQRALLEGGSAAMGSPAFMAPEQWDGAAATPAADQFAFAALAYYMLTGSRPFEGQDSPEIRQKNFRQGVIPAHEEARQNGRPAIPRAASEVLKRALSVAPEGRYASIGQFTGALLKALQSGHLAGAEPLVFVSYDRELSGGWARFFADRLKEHHGIRVFMDTSGLDRAGRFSPRLRRAIDECDVFVVFLAGSTLQSRWVSEEIRLAHEFGKIMIPVFQESYVEPPVTEEESPVTALIAHQGIKLFDVSGHYVDHAVSDLARLVKGALRADAEPL